MGLPHLPFEIDLIYEVPPKALHWNYDFYS
jgi:hypothetical protein